MKQFTRKPNVSCKICCKEIYKRPSQIANDRNIYCSQNCYGKACTILITCPVCEVKFKSGLNKKTCSRACANKLRIGTSYKNGKPYKDKVTTQRSLKNRLVILRGAKCERCPYSKVNILHVHHKIRRADGGSNEIENLELICPNCHAEEHHDENKSRKRVREAEEASLEN